MVVGARTLAAIAFMFGQNQQAGCAGTGDAVCRLTLSPIAA